MVSVLSIWRWSEGPAPRFVDVDIVQVNWFVQCKRLQWSHAICAMHINKTLFLNMDLHGSRDFPDVRREPEPFILVGAWGLNQEYVLRRSKARFRLPK